MIELPYEVKLKIVIDDLNIKCTNLQRAQLDADITGSEWQRLDTKLKEARRKREWAYVELHKLKEVMSNDRESITNT